MARIRTIKPGFFQSITLSGLSLAAERHFAGLFTYSDDEGRGQDEARLLKAALWPLRDEMTAPKIERLMVELADAGLIARYTVNGRAFYQITGWSEHQHINRPTPSKYPAPTEDSLRTHGGLTEDSRQEGKGKEGKGTGKGEGARSRALPPDFDLDETRTAYAREQGVTNPAAAFAHFRDHHTAKGTTFRDWDAAWRTWCRNEVKFARSTPNRADPKPHVSRPLSDADRERAAAALKREEERRAALSAPVSEDAKAKAAAFIADLSERKRMPR